MRCSCLFLLPRFPLIAVVVVQNLQQSVVFIGHPLADLPDRRVHPIAYLPVVP